MPFKMNTKSLSFFLPLFVLSHSFDGLHTRNETLTQEYRQPRVTGRIVKVYSGTRPQPVVCPGEGFQPDPLDCSVFYRCIVSTNGKYTSFRFQCGPGTIYDPDAEVCNFPQSTRRSECGGIPAQFVPRHHKNELDNVKYELPSPIRNLPYFEATTTKGRHSTFNPFAATTKRQTIQSTSSTLPMQTTHYQISELSKSLSPTHSSNSQNGDRCTTDGFLGDSEDCRKFYRCVGNLRGGFIRYEFMCSENTIWDENAQSCNHAWAVKRRRCSHNNTQETTVPDFSAKLPNGGNAHNQTIQQQLQINYGSKVSQTQTQISDGPGVIQNQTQINYGDRLENKRESSIKQNQSQINHGSAVSQTQTQINYGNKGSQTQLQIDHTKEASQSQTQIQHDSYQESSSNENASNECTQSGFMGDKKDCKKFYRCVDNGKGSYTKYEFSCGEGTIWDSNIEGCNHAWAVKDCNRKSPSTTHTQNNQSISTTVATTSTQNYHTTSGSTTDNKEEDNSYGNQISTSHNNALQNSSTTSNSQNNPTTQALASEKTECSSSGFIGDNSDCKKFYRCVDNGSGSFTKYEFKCGEGTVWDSEIEACNHVWAVNKCGGSSSINHNQVETTTLKNTAMTTVTLILTTTEELGQNNDYEVGYGQQQNESPSTTTSATTKHTQTEETNKCNSSGFMGYKNDCKKFYRCVDNGNGAYLRYEFSCGEGTVWDPKIKACNHPWSVEHCGEDNTDFNKETTTIKVNEEGTPSFSTETQTISTLTKEPSLVTTGKPASANQCKKEGFVGDSNDCKKFYRCVDNGRGGFIKYEFSCGEGTVWDPEINTCNYPSPNHSCSESEDATTTVPIEKEEDEMYTETTTIKLTAPSESAENISSTSHIPQTVEKSCQSEGFYGDPDECKRFYRCVDNGKGGYTKYDFTCGDGTVWDQELKGCNHATEKKNCPQNSSSQSQATTTITYSSSTMSSTTLHHQEYSTTKPEHDHCSSEGFYANSKDCKKFYRCVDNGKGRFTKYDFACGEGTIWVQELQTCDHDNGMSRCSEINTDSQGTDNFEQTTTTSSAIPPKENDEYPTEPSHDSLTSEKECTAEGFYPNKNDCTRFYRCVDRGNGGYTKYDFTCGEGTAWDSDVQTCNHKNEVESCQDSYQSKPQEHDEGTTEGSTTKTTTSGSTNVSSKPENTETCEKEGFHGNKNDCEKFYRCVDNGNGGFTKYDFTCGDGTVWDQDLTTCNHPQDVKNPSCQQNESNSTTSSSSTSSTTTTNESSSGTSQNNENCSQEDSSKQPINKDVNCTKAGFYADPNDCKKFYRCVDWDGEGQKFSVFHFACGEGTIWDPALDTCNHEDSVYPPRDCTGSQSQSENSSQEPTESTPTTQKESTIQDGSTTISQATTEEQTITQQSTTQIQTTTEQTTQQSTSSQQTTTKQSTTSEQTTTQQTSTSEQATTQQSTTSKQSTTQESTTKQTTEQATTQESTTASEETTTQQSTTSEESSTQQSTTEQTMTESTTDISTTDQQTTSQSNENTEQTTSTTESSTTESEQESTTENGQGTTESISQEKECPETDEDQNLFVCPTSFRRHPKYCNLFYQCEEDEDSHEVKIAVFKCPNETIYDETQTKCVEKDKADKKCDGEMAKKRRLKRFDADYKEPATITRENFSCLEIGNFPLEKEECSPAFFKCQKLKSGILRGYIYQCPEGYLYWSVSKRCEQQTNIKFCKKSQLTWYRSWQVSVERKNVAK